jgi:hypothetical protein
MSNDCDTRKMICTIGAALAALCFAAGCSADTGDEKQRAAPESTSSAAALTGSGTSLDAGSYEFSFLGIPATRASIEVPDGFTDGSHWYVVSPDGDTFLGLWTTQSIERDACLAPDDDDITPGPSVEELASALVDQGSTETSEPTEVSLDGYDGIYLEVSGPVDLGSCGAGPGLANGRGIYSDDQLDRLWILDVDGQRLVVDAASGPTSSPAEVDALSSMVESIEFATGAR